jgi:hypothetical protein
MLDAHAPTFDVTTSHVVAVDASPDSVLAGLDSLELARPVARTIELLGTADRIALDPSPLTPSRGRERVYGLVWRVADDDAAVRIPVRALSAFAEPGYVKVIWDVRVNHDPDAGTYVSTTTRFVATDDGARERLRGAWRVLGPMSADLAKRALASIKHVAERGTEPLAYGSVSGFPAPAARAALASVA